MFTATTRILKTVLTLCFAGTLFLAPSASASSDETKLDDELTQAREAYDAGRYNETIKLANLRLNANHVSAIDRVEIYRLQGLAYNAQGKQRKARRAVNNLVMVYPQYAPQTTDPQAFKTMVLEAQERHAQGTLTRKKGRAAQYIYTAVGVAMSAVVLGLVAQDF
ncbi:MAG: hypothetical protein ACR2GR_04735 [Rhodothermales bacterium]